MKVQNRQLRIPSRGSGEARPAWWLLAGALLLALLAGCRQSPRPAAEKTTQQYHVRGKVVSVDPKTGVLSLATETIPGFMDAMTMAYTLEDPAAATELHPGDTITANLVMDARGAVLGDVVIVGRASLNIPPARPVHIPEPGDAVPDFQFTNQDGRRIDLGQFRGKVLVLTFIYTRCADQQFCIRMSRNFADLERRIAADPALAGRTHLLSISFDPAHDTPEVLRKYGVAYTAGRPHAFDHWDFAAPSRHELASLLQWFDVGVTSRGGDVLMHSVSTAVIGRDGKLRTWYPSNDWTPEQALAAVHQALAGPVR